MRNYAMVNIFVIGTRDLEATVRHCGPFSLICYLGQRLLRILNRLGQVPTIVFHSNHDGPISHRRPTATIQECTRRCDVQTDDRQTETSLSISTHALPCMRRLETVSLVSFMAYGISTYIGMALLMSVQMCICKVSVSVIHYRSYRYRIA